MTDFTDPHPPVPAALPSAPIPLEYAGPITPAAKPIQLGYAGKDLSSRAIELITVARCGSAAEAAMKVNALEAMGIMARTANHSSETIGLYSGGTSVEVQVRRCDSAQAAEAILLATSDELEPADDSSPASAPVDAEGKPLELAVVASFASPRALRDSATVLESARVTTYLPRLVVRGDRPAGVGKRFVLRVRAEDADRAAQILEDADDADNEDDDPRCPKCGSWRVFPVPRFLRTVAYMFGIGAKPEDEVECLSCHHTAAKSEFEP